MDVRLASPADFARLAAHYAAWGYRGGIAPDDAVLVAEDAAAGGAPVGIVRQTVEGGGDGVVMLRGMYVAPGRRGRGVGSALLDAFVRRLDREPDLRGRACYGVPLAHLERFYARGGFAFIPAAEAPAFLRARVRQYETEGHRVAVMRREPAGGAASRAG
jgi:GNAT superfamily N-acetyltransferase